MTLSEYVEYLFGVATGWLGWTPDVAWSTPIPEIHAALKARIRWEQMVNGVESDEDKQEKMKQRLRGWGR